MHAARRAVAHLRKTAPVGAIHDPVSSGTNLPLVQAKSSQSIHEGFGVVAHVSFDGVYQGANMATYLDYLVDMGARYFRGRYIPGNPGTTQAVTMARERGLKWLMLVAPEAIDGPTSQTVAQTRVVVQHIAANAADLCCGIEGLNEPNQNRASPGQTAGPVPTNWATTTVAHQNAIRQEMDASALAGVPLLGPSLHDTAAADSYNKTAAAMTGLGGLAHYDQLYAAGLRLGVNFDYCGMHRYSGGFPPVTTALDQRIGWIRSAFGAATPLWVTETGYHTAVNMPYDPANPGKGHKPVDEATLTTYTPRIAMEMVAGLGMRVVLYELLDDVNPAKDAPESNLGLYRVDAITPTTGWTAKPAAGALGTMLNALSDPGPAYTPGLVPVLVGTGSADTRYVVTAKRDGSARVWLWRNASVWDPLQRVPLPAGRTTVTTTVVDRFGPRSFQVGPDVISVPIR